MFTSFLSHLDWLSVWYWRYSRYGYFQRCISPVKQKIKRQVSEQQQQLLLLQSQYEHTQNQYASLVEEHDLLGLTHQEQRDQSQHFKTRLTEQEKQSQLYNQYWRKAEAELTALREQYNLRDVELNNIRTTLEQKQQHFSEQLAHIEQSKETLKKEFENLANQILEEKSQKFKNPQSRKHRAVT